MDPQESSLTLLQSSNQVVTTAQPPNSLFNTSHWYNDVADPRVRSDYDYRKFTFNISIWVKLYHSEFI